MVDLAAPEDRYVLTTYPVTPTAGASGLHLS
jgi:hypothetical protein